jgi:outer membrane protein assembly factor BamB
MGRMALLIALLVGTVPAPAQPPDAAALRGESAQTRKRLAEAEAKVLGDKPADAIDELQRILDDSGDDLIGVGAKHFRPARWVAHGILAKLRGDALKAYQDRIDEPARKLLAAGKQSRNPRHLWALLDRYFVSRPSEEGLLLLGELLFERGDFRAAETTWRRLLPDSDTPFPSPKTDPAAVWAKVILAAIYQGEHERAKAELAAFRQKHPAAKGVFAGKDGPFADTLQSLLDTPPVLAEPIGRDWATLGGGPERSGRVGGQFPTHWPTRPTWRHPHAGALAYSHAVIADGRVYVPTGNKLCSYDLRTGRETGSAAAAAFGTLTAADGRIYARLGPPAVNGTADTELACFDRSLNKLWQLKPPATGEIQPPAAWEGAPVVAGRRMWALVARFEGGRVNHAVACYDPADADAAPDRPAWLTEVSDSPLSLVEGGRPRHELLTLAGRHVVFCSHAGVVVALDATTGRKAWAFRYPRAARRANEAARIADPAPAVAFGGRVFVAPADADRVFALDAETGETLWESAPADGAQIVGVSRGRLIVTISGQVRGLRALSVLNGTQREPDGWVQHDGGGLPTHGRGVASDDVIVWPTTAGVFFVRPDDGLPMRDPLRTALAFPQSGRLGNVAAADGCMVIVTPNQILGYVPDSKVFDLSDAALDGALEPRADPAAKKPAAPHRNAGDVPSLTAEADIDREVRLPPSSFPLQPIRGALPPTHLFASAGSQLVKVGVTGGLAPPFHTDDALTHAADFPGGTVTAGPGAVAVYGVGVRPDWVFRVPHTHLSSFALAGSWLFARIGEHHLVALDLAAKRVAWVLGAHGRSRFEPVAALLPERIRPRRATLRRAAVGITNRNRSRPERGRLDAERPRSARLRDADGASRVAAPAGRSGRRKSRVFRRPWPRPRLRPAHRPRQVEVGRARRTQPHRRSPAGACVGRQHPRRGTAESRRRGGTGRAESRLFPVGQAGVHRGGRREPEPRRRGPVARVPARREPPHGNDARPRQARVGSRPSRDERGRRLGGAGRADGGDRVPRVCDSGRVAPRRVRAVRAVVAEAAVRVATPRGGGGAV